ncbi:hypothetical protein ASB57_26210 [Bordetella sp. N]|nr:hypothetical protein ASB57_26210 [Bordetella sp. N]
MVLERFFFFLTDVIAPSHAGFFLQRAGEPDGASLLQGRYATAALQAERFLKHNDYMAGAEFSIADIAAFTILKSLRANVPWDGSQEMAAWFRRVEARPAVQRGLRAFD